MSVKSDRASGKQEHQVLTGCPKPGTFLATFFWWEGGDAKEPDFSPAPVREPFPSPGWRCRWRLATTPSAGPGGAAPGQKALRAGWTPSCVREIARDVCRRDVSGNARATGSAVRRDSQARRKRETVSAFVFRLKFREEVMAQRRKGLLRVVLGRARMILQAWCEHLKLQSIPHSSQLRMESMEWFLASGHIVLWLSGLGSRFSALPH